MHSGGVTTDDELLTAVAAAEAAGVHRNTVMNWRATGRVNAVCVAGRWLYRRREIEALAAERRGEVAA